MGKAWLEMRQWWNTYITNNYQISAAIALGYYDLAKEALLFFGLQPGGYVLLDANGKTVPPYANAYDGLLYYIPQLYQYTMQTGDMSVMEMVADNVVFMLDGMEHFRVQSPSGLFSYRLGCNMFMYQADHLGMPGESASASMMMACDYQLFAVLCRKIGRNDLAEQYEKRAQSIWDILPERLWNKERQCFYNHVDLQGKPHNAHYYTDLVFPQLYTSLDRTYKLNSLAYLKESLLFPSHTTKMPLMRVGDFKPTIFANDNVMPTQMAEAARAFMQSGDTMLAAALMESVAFASTIYTDSPGSMPERMNDEGRGEPNFQLGNAIGSFLYTYIAGLFGIRVDNFGNELHIEPAFPDDWDHACLELPYCRLEFSRVNRDEIVLKIKQAENYPALVIGVVVPPCSHAEMYVNGKEYPVCLSPLLGHTRVCAEITGLAEEINVVIHIHEQEIEQPELISGLEGFPIVSDYDIIEDNAVTNGNVVPGEYCLYARSKAACALIEIPVIIKPRNEIMVLEILDLPSGHCRITMMAEFPLQKEMICQIRNLSMENSPVLVRELLQGSKGFYGISSVLRWQTPAAYTALLEVSFYDPATEKCIYQEQRSVQWKNKQEMEHLSLAKVDLGETASDEKIYVDSEWRGYMMPLGITGINQNQPILEKDGHWFFTETSRENSQYRRFCLLCGGLSDKATRDIIPGEYRESATWKIEKHVRTLELLYASEIESRLTGAVVGQILLHYENGYQQSVPLRVGENISTIYHNFAAKTDRVSLVGEGLTGNDSASILSIGCNFNLKLESFSIVVDTRDTSIALMAATVMW